MKSKYLIAALVLICVLAFGHAPAYCAALPPHADDISALSAVLIDAKTGVVIYQKEMNEILYPASITKIMTVLLALENGGDDYEERVYFSNEAVYSIPSDSSHIWMDAGETLTFEHALYAIMLRSANEVSNAVAEHIAGTMDEFVWLMNKRAAELSAVNTQYKNAHGYHDDEHYTTAYDISLIMRECIKHPFFLTLISTELINIPPTEKHEEVRSLQNTNRMIRQGEYYNEDVVGGKTGFTTPAGNTLVTYAVRDDIELITVVLKSEGTKSYTDTELLLEFGFSAYEDMKIFDKKWPTFKDKLPVVQIYRERVIDLGFTEIIPEKGLEYFLPFNTDLSDIVITTDLPDTLTAPVTPGQKVGTASFHINGFYLGGVDIITQSEIPLIDALQLDYEERSAALRETALEVFSSLKTMFIIFLCIFAPVFCMRVFNRHKRRRRIRRRRILRYG